MQPHPNVNFSAMSNLLANRVLLYLSNQPKHDVAALLLHAAIMEETRTFGAVTEYRYILEEGTPESPPEPDVPADPAGFSGDSPEGDETAPEATEPPIDATDAVPPPEATGIPMPDDVTPEPPPEEKAKWTPSARKQ